MMLAIDLDGTLLDTQNVLQGYKMGPPEKGAVATINKLVEEGHQIVVFTARNVQDSRVKQAVADWLNYFKIPFYDITNIKRTEFDVFIDNKGLHYQSWPQAYEDLHKAEANWDNWSDHVKERQPFTDITKPINEQ